MTAEQGGTTPFTKTYFKEIRSDTTKQATQVDEIRSSGVAQVDPRIKI
jgi:hypothetical protein